MNLDDRKPHVVIRDKTCTLEPALGLYPLAFTETIALIGRTLNDKPA